MKNLIRQVRKREIDSQIKREIGSDRSKKDQEDGRKRKEKRSAQNLLFNVICITGIPKKKKSNTIQKSTYLESSVNKKGNE